MGEEDVTEFIKKILGKSETWPYFAHFKGISDEKFKSYSFEDFKLLLPSTEEGELAAAEIKAQIELAVMMEGFKAEKRAGGDVSSFFQTSEIQVEAPAKNESGGDGADEIKVEIVPQKEVEVVTLDSDDDEEVGKSKNNQKCESLGSLPDEDNSQLPDSEEPRTKRQRQVGLPSTTEPVTEASEIQTVLNLKKSIESSIHSCMIEEGSAGQQWYDEVHGQHCTTINALQWCWKPLNHRCQYNLFRILCNSPNLEELNLYNDATDSPADIELTEGSLQKLMKLVAFRERKIDFKDPLRTILKMATSLKNFEYQFSTETDEDLGLLGDFDLSELWRLAVTSIASPSYLTKAQVANLLRVRAPKLNNLWIGHGLYEDVSGDLLENVLKNFPILQTLYIPGQYYSHTDAHPAVTIHFPKLSQLKDLCLGGNYAYMERL